MDRYTRNIKWMSCLLNTPRCKISTIKLNKTVTSEIKSVINISRLDGQKSNFFGHSTSSSQIIKVCALHCTYSSFVLNPSVNRPVVPRFFNINCTGRTQVRHFSFQSTIESVAMTQTGWFKSLSESSAVSYAQDFFVSIHDITGLPWWASIIFSTIILRTFITMPLAVYQNYIFAKVENLTLEMPAIVKELKRETAIAIKKYNWSEKQARTIYNRSLRKQWKQLIIRDNCHPFKASILLWVQIPMWICFSSALRNLVYMLPNSDAVAQIICMELSVGGFGWIPNLSAVDSSLILPIAFGILNLGIIELQAMTRVKKASRLQTIVTNFFRGFSLVMIPIAASVPACLCLYWTTSTAFGLAQNLVLLSPKVKRLTGIPESPSELSRPYQHIAAKILERVAWKSMPFSPKG